MPAAAARVKRERGSVTLHSQNRAEGVNDAMTGCGRGREADMSHEEHTANCTIRWDLERRRITLIYTGHVTDADEISAIGAHLLAPIEAMAGVDSFDFFTIFTESLGQLCDVEVRQCQALYGPLKQIGLRRIVRVIEPGCPTDTTPIDRAAKEEGVPVHVFGDRAEAEAFLDADPVARPVAAEIAAG